VTISPTQKVLERPDGVLSLFRHRNYAALWIGQLISQTGDRLHWVAISLWVYATTGSALSVSYAIMALLVGPAVVGIFAGALVDHLDRRKILIYGDLLRAVLVFAIPSLMAQGLAWVYVDLFFISAVSAFFRPAMFAAIPQSVPKNKLLEANALFASMDTSTEIFGPALAGIVIAQRGYTAALYLDAISYLLSAIFVSVLRFPSQAQSDLPSQEGATRQRTLEAIRQGLQYIRGDSIQVGLLALLIGGYWVAGLNSLQTPLAKHVLGVSDGQFGWFLSVGGLGYVTGSLLLGWYGRRFPKGKMVVFSYLLWAVAAAMMGLSLNYGMLLAAGFWVGFANMLLFVNVGTIMMEHTPSKMIGRTITTRQTVVACMRAIALVGFGWLADHFGVRFAIVTMAGISLVGTGVAAVRSSTLWHYDSNRASETPSASRVDSRLEFRKVMRSLYNKIEPRMDPQFASDEQRRLNRMVLILLGMGWLAFLVTNQLHALAIVGASAVSLCIASLARSIARLRPAARRDSERA
jgi:MFS family permease